MWQCSLPYKTIWYVPCPQYLFQSLHVDIYHVKIPKDLDNPLSSSCCTIWEKKKVEHFISNSQHSKDQQMKCMFFYCALSLRYWVRCWPIDLFNKDPIMDFFQNVEL